MLQGNTALSDLPTFPKFRAGFSRTSGVLFLSAVRVVAKFPLSYVKRRYELLCAVPRHDTIQCQTSRWVPAQIVTCLDAIKAIMRLQAVQPRRDATL